MKLFCLPSLRPTATQSATRLKLQASDRRLTKLVDSSQSLPSPSSAHELFKYTSGRWVYNENQRFKERERTFNVAGLQRLAAKAVSRKVEDIHSITKLSAKERPIVPLSFDSAMISNSLLVSHIQSQNRDSNLSLVKPLRCPFFDQRAYQFQRYMATRLQLKNLAETEYILLEFRSGKNLGTLWADMNENNRLRFIKSLVALESCLFQIRVPASGSLYFLREFDRGLYKASSRI
ncbi:uncharacterized protein RCC_11204 [Ramularia collo-cygni]|uniref:Protein kinase domain-containing protein n=1 Tax=Ramularia collo-cygni TaxID=112498 RepID=A0A2D3VJ43_9PEZI|nr:uncharacterized protein RCC_11204 [Ramularia collo-cygni]CZT25472.1 uncharacterized protein RCC_11204 [Ramularia collo-cygni]